MFPVNEGHKLAKWTYTHAQGCVYTCKYKQVGYLPRARGYDHGQQVDNKGQYHEYGSVMALSGFGGLGLNAEGQGVGDMRLRRYWRRGVLDDNTSLKIDRHPDYSNCNVFDEIPSIEVQSCLEVIHVC